MTFETQRKTEQVLLLTKLKVLKSPTTGNPEMTIKTTECYKHNRVVHQLLDVESLIDMTEDIE